MNLSELCFIVTAFVTAIALSACIIAVYMRKIRLSSAKKKNRIYLEKLGNSDTSIQNAMNYLKLTNSIVDQKGK